MMEVLSVGGSSPTTAIRNTVMFSIAEMPGLRHVHDV